MRRLVYQMPGTEMLLETAIAGYCVAGGLEIAWWCDLRIAEETAVLGCFERRFGVPLGLVTEIVPSG
jgi:enoyl-CoA hydratase/carnithine racemase